MKKLRYQIFWRPSLRKRDLLGTYDTMKELLSQASVEIAEDCWGLNASDIEDIVVEKQEVKILEIFKLTELKGELK